MAVHYFLVAVEDKDIEDARWLKPRKGAELAGWRLFHDLAMHLGPDAEPYSHVKGVYSAVPAGHGLTPLFAKGDKVTDG